MERKCNEYFYSSIIFYYCWKASKPLNRFNTIDNNLNTSWSAIGDVQSINYTFDKSYNVSKVGIAFYKGNVRENFFEINDK
jgi:hypothetical protein